MIRAIFGIGAFVAAMAIFFLYTQPAYDGAKVIKAEIERYNSALDRAAELQQLKQTLLSRFNAFNPEDIENLRKLLPDHVDNVRLVFDLDNLASKHGMALQNVIISNPIDSSNSASAAGVIGAGREKYDSLTLQFNTQATYPSFLAFLADLETSLRIADVVSLSLRPVAVGERSEPTYSFQIIIRTYWLK